MNDFPKLLSSAYALMSMLLLLSEMTVYMDPAYKTNRALWALLGPLGDRIL